MVSSDIQVLNPLSFPLHGARLIEASAGTGKTFTICSLYLRLLLGHGTEDCRHPYPLTVDQILVVTFTEAATEELRSRIRTRIKEARYAFLRGHTDDFFLDALLKETQNHTLAAELLLQAERQMDESSVFTIHGFCQRMLVNSAFESGSLFETSFLTDETKLRQQVVSDYWRKRFYDLSPEISEIIRNEWKSPSALLSDINSHLSGVPIYVKGKSLSGDISKAHLENIDTIKALKEKWLAVESTVQATIFNSGINRRSYTAKSTVNWCNSVTAWARTETTSYTIPDALSRFSQTMLDEKSKSNPPNAPIFQEVDAFLKEPIGLISGLMKDAIECCRTLLKEAKEKIYVLAFDDLLTQLNSALSGDQGKVLAKRIREMYPVAMIDEFQDTDPLQYNIFSNIYRPRLVQKVDIKDSGIFIIGDPKQAIYAFRGADIFTYIKARREVNAHYTLNTNWRSTSRMINAVNSVFMNSSSPFIYDDDIEFRPALSSPKADKIFWQIDGAMQPALTIWNNPEHALPISKGSYAEEMTIATVEQIKELLTNSEAKIINGDSSRRVKAGDIAILVRTSAEANVVRKALAIQNIASVYLSNRDSVFATREAQDILRIMNAMNEPLDERQLKPALATHLLGADADDLIALEQDEHALESVVLEFSTYAKTWEKKGIMPALREVLLNRKIAERLLSYVDGERQVTDFLHIGELLQEESQKTTSNHGLIRWLTEKIEEPDGNADDQQVRLDSESDLVKVVTIHKSKGLEYNFVFLPFVAAYRESKKSVYHDQDKGMTVLDPKKSNFSKGRSEHERLAEDLRLVYVALTRAVYGCFIGVAPLRDGQKRSGATGLHKSAMGWLLQNGEVCDAPKLALALDLLSSQCDDITIQSPPEEGICKGEVINETVEINIEARKNCRHITENWYVTSFSALSAHSHTHKYVKPEFVFEEDEDEAEEEPQLSIFNFYKGAKAGTFLHTVFENIDYNHPTCPENETTVKELLLLEGYEEEWAPIIMKLVQDVLSKSMTSTEIVLSKVAKDKMLCEMEFTFPITKLNAQKLAKVCTKHDPISKGMELNFFDVSGMLKGFIDLTFEYDGKFYVLDWKSNHLGDDKACYTQDAISEAMRDHRYDLQYQIYSYALHKFLATRIPDYSYEQHFGGVLYLFLRGVNNENDNGIYFAKPSEKFLDEMNNVLQAKG
ncbi:exodeoxyribonuclease V subunit beta [Vibrio coralliirubri]|uniref:exodeoxyribonuclease V subunit beta n=1 Tax=Vibrio coralliirubri TaxID=1516159 RepID=UPI00228415C6|nr:exodeoxyribonuclease V subunit beta [Vibrio coralliirubri]MCY9861284.1 exodeoxyribonuclease V subunit beta [Vibrio coralliirubri]